MIRWTPGKYLYALGMGGASVFVELVSSEFSLENEVFCRFFMQEK